MHTKLRELIILGYHRETSMYQIANIFNLTKSTVEDIIKRCGEIESTQVAGKSPGCSRMISDRSQRNSVRFARICVALR